MTTIGPYPYGYIGIGNYFVRNTPILTTPQLLTSPGDVYIPLASFPEPSDATNGDVFMLNNQEVAVSSYQAFEIKRHIDAITEDSTVTASSGRTEEHIDFLEKQLHKIATHSQNL